MERSIDQQSERIFDLAASILFGAVLLRLIPIQHDSLEFGETPGLLFILLGLYGNEPAIPYRIPLCFPIGRVLFTTLVFGLLILLRLPDFFTAPFQHLLQQTQAKAILPSGGLNFDPKDVIKGTKLSRYYKTSEFVPKSG